MHAHGDGTALRMPVAATVSELAHKLLLLRVHRHNRMAKLLQRPRSVVDPPELPVPVQMLTRLDGLAVRLETVAEFVQQAVHRALADLAALRPHPRRKRGRAVAGPAQRTLRATAVHRLKLAVKRGQQFRVARRQAPVPAAWLPRSPVGGTPLGRCRDTRSDVLDACRTMAGKRPVASAKREVPPRPIALASTPAQRRRPCSSRTGRIISNFCLRVSTTQSRRPDLGRRPKAPSRPH